MLVIGGLFFVFGYVYKQFLCEWVAYIVWAIGVVYYLYYRKQK